MNVSFTNFLEPLFLDEEMRFTYGSYYAISNNKIKNFLYKGRKRTIYWHSGGWDHINSIMKVYK